ncbi:MAG: hypothetical protein EZS28_003370 [Streblomastix strix]|uniref:Uncharacterized protein n=1 Tax=Streblomastix strix TaxID=222440 RepID=A0A5J4X1J0_9EUKA|nr:MAG: hypothetical protein EZS28_003370 [Streblomastix strix]
MHCPRSAITVTIVVAVTINIIIQVKVLLQEIRITVAVYFTTMVIAEIAVVGSEMTTRMKIVGKFQNYSEIWVYLITVMQRRIECFIAANFG